MKTPPKLARKRNRERDMMSRWDREEAPCNGFQKRERMALGLAILEASLEPGQAMSLEDIAAYCACTRESIRKIEQSALRKLRDYATRHPELRDIWHTLNSIHDRRTSTVWDAIANG